jgi:hypothetical protein
MIFFWLLVGLLAIIVVVYRFKRNNSQQVNIVSTDMLPIQSGTKHWLLEPVYMQVQNTNGVSVEVDWAATFLVIKQAVSQKDYDFARTWLQKFSYASVKADVSQNVRDDFKRLMTAFANEDPLYRTLISQILPLVSAQPGILQTAIYPQILSYNEEQIRYALYFAHELGDITRVKKGRSYQLFPSSKS